MKRPGAKGPGNELAREREGQGAKGPGRKSSRERIGQGPICRFATGSELAREGKGSVPELTPYQTKYHYDCCCLLVYKLR